MSAIRAAVSCSLLALLAAAPSTVRASSIHRVTFTGNASIPPPSAVWVEDGVIATGAVSGVDAVHLDPGGVPYGREVSFTTGGLFDAVSIDIASPGGLYCDTTIRLECGSYEDPYPNVWITGFVDDRVVSTLSISRATVDGFETFVLGDAFAGLDRLTVAVRSIYELGLTGSVETYYSGHFSIDDVVLRDAPAIPEPTSVISFGIGLLLVARTRGGDPLRHRRPLGRGTSQSRRVPDAASNR